MKRRNTSLLKNVFYSWWLSFKTCVALMLFATNAPAQNTYAVNKINNKQVQQITAAQQKKVSLHVKNEKLSAIFERIEKQVDYVFVYSNDDININQRLSVDVDNTALDTVLQILFKNNVQYKIMNNKIVLHIKNRQANANNITGNPGYINAENINTKIISVYDIIVTGRVTNEKGEALANVSVTLKGTKTGTVTDASGNFTLRIADDLANGTLVFSSVGFTPREENINGRNSIAVALIAADKNLEDVVVVGYSTQKRSSVTGAVDVITSKSIQDRPVTNLSTALQGTSPNLIIQQRSFEPGQGVNINIRGIGTLGDNTPLVVIDGIAGGDINLINPNDIASVSILKDAGSAAIYGSRAANGVILITTKSGRKNEKPTINYSGIYGVQTPRITYEPVDAWENAYYKNVSLVNSGLAPSSTPQQIRDLDAKGNGDWKVNNIVQPAPQQTHTISISGGSANTTYLLSAGYFDQANNFVGPDYGYKRYNVRLNVATEIGKLNLNTILSYVKVQNKDHSYNSGTLMVDASRVPLYYSFQDTAGNYLTNPVSAELNPKGILEKGGYRQSDDDEIYGNFNATYSITNDLKIKGLFGATVRSNSQYSRVLEVDFLPGGSYGSNREVSNVNFKSLFTNIQLLAEYTKKINGHNINILAGAANESYEEKTNALYQILTDPQLGVPTTGTEIDETRSFNSNGTNLSNGNPATIETSINSLFGRAAYNFNERYFAEFDFRYDGSSKFAEGNRWGFFPSGSVAWRLTEEEFFDGLQQSVGDFKLRATYGVLGNQNVNAYQYQTTFFNYPNSYAFNNVAVGGSGYSLGNPDLTWERAATFNVGLDATLLKGRLTASFDYFDKTTSDILATREDVPQLFGAGFPNYNVAKVRNKGWEFKASYNIPGKVVMQTISINLADNLNELLTLTAGATEIKQTFEEYEILRRIGQPTTVYYGYKRNGYFQTLDDVKNYPKFANSTVSPGDIKFTDRNGDGVIDDNDKFILGNPFPRYTYGFTYTIAVKGFDLQLFVQGVGKRDAMIRGEQVETFHVGYSGTMYTHQTDFWTPTNPDAAYPKLSENGSADNKNNYRTGSDIFLFDAAYARLKNLQIGYTIPARITQKIKISRARIYFTGQNLITLSKLNFLDPEITEFNNNVSFSTGANSARAYFMPIFYGGGINITF